MHQMLFPPYQMGHLQRLFYYKTEAMKQEVPLASRVDKGEIVFKKTLI
jgi:hypothetical protein